MERIKNTNVNPITNPKALIIFLVLFFSSSPIKYDIYIGIIGRRQGEIKLAIPSKNVNKYSIYTPL